MYPLHTCLIPLSSLPYLLLPCFINPVTYICDPSLCVHNPDLLSVSSSSGPHPTGNHSQKQGHPKVPGRYLCLREGDSSGGRVVEHTRLERASCLTGGLVSLCIASLNFSLYLFFFHLHFSLFISLFYEMCCYSCAWLLSGFNPPAVICLAVLITYHIFTLLNFFIFTNLTVPCSSNTLCMLHVCASGQYCMFWLLVCVKAVITCRPPPLIFVGGVFLNRFQSCFLPTTSNIKINPSVSLFSRAHPAGHCGAEKRHPEVSGWNLCQREDHCGGAAWWLTTLVLVKKKICQ